ncbi:MAG: hypothetical protein K0S79_190 [Nitrospira sp.]|jgi:hypothetical protein|nr:hypothetical protein [Nitrospira sp.]
MNQTEFDFITGQINAISMGLVSVMSALSPASCLTAAVKLQASLEVDEEGGSGGSEQAMLIRRQIVEAYLDLLHTRARG